MIVDKITLKNFRCFGDEPITIDVQKHTVAFIGANNVGKSTALRAVELLLGDKWPVSQFNEEDFFNNELDREILLVCSFTKPVEIAQEANNYAVKGVAIQVKHIKSGVGQSSLEVEYRLLQNVNHATISNFESLDVITYGVRGRPVYINQTIKNQLPIAVTIPLLKLRAEQPTNKWSVLGRMLQKVESQLSVKEKKQFELDMEKAVKNLRDPAGFKSIENAVEKFWTEIKPRNLSETALKFLDYEPWRYYRQFKLAVTQHGQEKPVENLGEGVQRLAIIALYRTYLKHHGRKQQAILLIEEPESYLHPQARATVFNALKKAVKTAEEQEGQIFYTTHSEDFIEAGRFDNIAIFSSREESVIVRTLSTEELEKHIAALGFAGTALGDQRLYYHVLEAGCINLKTALFGERAVVVEGQTELELLNHFVNSQPEDFTAVSAGGKNNIPPVVGFLTAFGIPVLVIADKDKKVDKSSNTAMNERLTAVLTQPNAQAPDITAIKLKSDEIENINDNKLWVKDRVCIFSRNLEAYLQNVVPNYFDLISIVQKDYSVGKSKPRQLRAIGLAFKSNFGTADTQKEIRKAKKPLQKVSKELTEFVMQEMKFPKLLTIKR